MRHIKILLALSVFLVLTGCSSLKATKLIAPTWFGMEKIDERVFVNKEMSSAERSKILLLVTESETQIIKYYGKATTRPEYFFCSTEECYKSFGFTTSRAQSFASYGCLFSPRGTTVPIISHEWSHIELYSRINSSGTMRHIPQWFNEGLAVTVSEEPTHSENQWQYMITSNIPRPTREELLSIKTLREWLDAVHHFGEDLNKERKEKGNPPVAPLYTAAGHEVRLWFANANTKGLISFIDRMNNGENFDDAYSEVNPETK
jgi:hypothetical protein